MEKRFDVVCVGSALLDVYLKSDKFVKVASGEFEGRVALCEEYGGKTEVAEVEVASGGGGTNSAVSFARKGFRTALIAEMGTDLIAAAILEEMRREGVNTEMVIKEEDEETGIASIMVSGDGGRSVAVFRGASKMLTKEDIVWDKLRPDWLYISSLGGEMPLLEGLIGHAKTYGIKVAVNPGKAEIEGAEQWGGMELFEGIEVLLLNREEARQLSGVDLKNEEIWQGDKCEWGPKAVVITDGKRGGKVCSGGECVFYEAEPAETIEETGAGDAFGSGLVAALMKGYELERAIGWGKKQAARVVGYMGPKRGLMRLEEIEG